jgi:hypothetical protein
MAVSLGSCLHTDYVSLQHLTNLADTEGSPFHELGLKEIMDGVSSRPAVSAAPPRAAAATAAEAMASAAVLVYIDPPWPDHALLYPGLDLTSPLDTAV